MSRSPLGEREKVKPVPTFSKRNKTVEWEEKGINTPEHAFQNNCRAVTVLQKKEYRRKYPHGIICIRCGGAASRKFFPRVRNIGTCCWSAGDDFILIQNLTALKRH